LPDRAQEVVLADDPCAVTDQIDEQIKYLRLDRNHGSGSTQFAPFHIEHTVVEQPVHRPLLLPGL
jgi:hypothetical protein